MPCYYTGTAEGDARLAADEAHKSLTEVTAHLCWLCDYNERLLQANVLRERPPLWAWWQKHKALDAQHREQAAYEARQLVFRQAALRKLTKEEKEALGLWP